MQKATLTAVVAWAIVYAALWFALAGFDLADAPAAIVAVIAATWASLRLLPPLDTRISVLALGALGIRFAWQSLAAGLDVAWRALDPRLPLRPGFVTYKVRVPEGPARGAFLTIMSLLPGSLPAWQDEHGDVAIHCLDVDLPVAEQMAEEEKLFMRALGVRPADD